ncbi:1218_t:CDS:2 [Ambispora leptoticha]|uniref:1218_t:CDS:1 n=1 Tax=Ambispora leptoticha TaxID=144679 RepID=A0A9N9BG59_9GLOM|nr:1218_t:CDS:2 [Ambispora leptoticha]
MAVPTILPGYEIAFTIIEKLPIKFIDEKEKLYEQFMERRIDRALLKSGAIESSVKCIMNINSSLDDRKIEVPSVFMACEELYATVSTYGAGLHPAYTENPENEKKRIREMIESYKTNAVKWLSKPNKKHLWNRKHWRRENNSEDDYDYAMQYKLLWGTRKQIIDWLHDNRQAIIEFVSDNQYGLFGDENSNITSEYLQQEHLLHLALKPPNGNRHSNTTNIFFALYNAKSEPKRGLSLFKHAPRFRLEICAEINNRPGQNLEDPIDSWTCKSGIGIRHIMDRLIDSFPGSGETRRECLDYE